MKKVITSEDLHSEDFTITQDGKLRTNKDRVRLSYTLNMQTQNGANVWSNSNAAERSNLTVQDGFGRIHLDFKTTGTNQHRVATLPANAPTPFKLIEQQLYDGTTVWIDRNSRDIYVAAGATANRRYIVDMVGFFNA